MASVTKLSVRGVRAFNPDDSEQTVEFFCPITVLVGQNGCGKTTIIESLKYAITGSLPPGNKSGQAFVHDPRSIGSTHVKAGVKLRFTSRSGKQMVVARSMELTQKKNAKNVTFKQLDGVLRMIDERTGKKISQSHKCTELDKQIPTLMGISKAVLDNVLFCHQEEASWPLMEGAVLKKRFDDIFDSTRYTKALDVFRKTEKELLSDIKDIKADISSYGSHRHAAEGFRKELEEQNDIEEGLGEDKKAIQEEIAQIEEEMKKYDDILSKVMEVQGVVDVLNSKRSQARFNLKSKKSMIEDKHNYLDEHNKDELMEMLRDFDNKTEEMHQQEVDLSRTANNVQKEIDSLHNKEMELKSQVGKFHAKKEAHEKRVSARTSVMENLAQEFSLELQFSLTQGTNASFVQSVVRGGGGGASQDTMNTIELGPEEIKSFDDSLEDMDQQQKERLKEHQRNTYEEEDKLSKELTNLGGRHKAIEEERKKVKNERDEIKYKLDQIPKRDPTRSRKIRPKEIEEAKANAKKTAEKLKSANSSNRREEIQSQIRQLDTKVESIKRKLDDEKRILESLRETADAQNEITVLQEQCERDFDNLEDAVREEASTFLEFGLPKDPQLPKGDVDNGDATVDAVASIVDSVRGKYETVKDNLEKETRDANKLQSNLSEQTAILVRSSQQLDSLNAKSHRLSGPNGPLQKVRKVITDLRGRASRNGEVFDADEKSPEKLLAYLDEQIESHEGKLPGKLKGIKPLYKRIKDMMILPVVSGDQDYVMPIKGGKEDPNYKLHCPCCRRDMKASDGMDMDQYVEMLKDLLKEVQGSDEDPEKVEEYQRELDELSGWRKVVYDNQNGLREYWRIGDEVKDLDKEVQQLDIDVKKGQESVKDQKGAVDDLERELSGLRDLLDTTKRFIDDANRIAAKKVQISQKKTDLNINTPNCDRDLRTVEHDIAQQIDEKDSLTNKINELNKEMSQLNTAITELTNQLSQMEQRAKSLEEGYNAQQQQEEQRRTLMERDRELNDKFNELGKDLAPLHHKINKKEAEKKQLRAHTAEEEQKLVASINNFGNEVKRFRELTAAIDGWKNSDEPRRLEDLNAQLSEVASKIGLRKKDLDGVKVDLEKARDLVKDQERSKNQLQYNIDVLDLREAIKNVEKDIALKQEALAAIPGSDTAEELQVECDNKKLKLNERKAQINGRKGEVIERIRSLRRKLSAPEYKDVDEQYKVAMIRAETTQIAAEDLKKYQKALDQALLQYHSVKIAEVNKIIRELWLLTYKGEDIQNIEIVSGQDTGSRAQKSYNYRVVMTKGNSELDMRGRCSAGQRVLASIVIRLALAETFGVNCGCIALDEPTVNLDYKNKKGLAVALAQIVAARADQRNFQLIMITHDEDFVAIMKTELSSMTGFSMPEKYFEVVREQATDGKYYSKVHAKDWDELI